MSLVFFFIIIQSQFECRKDVNSFTIFSKGEKQLKETAEMMTDCRQTEGSIWSWHFLPSPAQRLRDVIVGNLCFSFKELNGF